MSGIFWALGTIILWSAISRWRRRKQEAKPVVVWFTGLSGAGKSTLAKQLVDRLSSEGRKVEYLDGDAIRQVLPYVGFSREERNTHIARVGLLASYLEKHGVSVVASFVSPYEESRRLARGLCRNFVEVHVSTPLSQCEERDAKGLYAKARRGEIRNFTGVSDDYEIPKNPELTIDTSSLSMDEALRQVTSHLEAGR